MYAVGRRGLSHLSPPGILGTSGTQTFQATWPLRIQVPSGLSGRCLFSPPGALGTAGLNRFSPQASPRRVGLTHFRPVGHISPQVPLGLEGSVFSVAQVPRGLARRNSSRLPGTFGTRGTRSFQPPKYAVGKPGLGHLSPPGILGTGGSQSFQATWSFRLQVPFGLARLN